MAFFTRKGLTVPEINVSTEDIHVHLSPLQTQVISKDSKESLRQCLHPPNSETINSYGVEV